ncbi:MAG TPA: AAA family ATPase, partial [Thermoanaerobaculia bacterium]|nr:AAA family ATPase [Thermoanaerobaculia bacterium]
MEDLRLLIRSRFPILYVETYEEKRLAELLAASASDLGLPFWSWSVTQGLCRRGVEDAAYETTQPLAALRHIASLRTAGVYLLYDLHPYLADPAVVRQLRECAQGSERQTTIVLCSPSLELPVELRRIAARYQLDLPGADDIRRAVVETFRSLNQNRHFRYELDDAALTRFARGLLGLTLEEVRRMVAQAMFEDLALTTADIPRVLERKRQAMARNGALELIPIDADTAPLGGLAHLKQWLERTHAGFSAQARSYGLPMPKGVLLAGVQGCGKSLAAKTIARQWGVPLARLEPGRLFDKYVGESERHLREALENAAALAPVVLWIDEIEK